MYKCTGEVATDLAPRGLLVYTCAHAYVATADLKSYALANVRGIYYKRTVL